MHNGSNTESQVQVQPANKLYISTVLIIELLAFWFFFDCVCIFMFMEYRYPGGESQSTCISSICYYLALQNLGAQGAIKPQHAGVPCMSE